MFKRIVYFLIGFMLFTLGAAMPARAQHFELKDDLWQVNFRFQLIRNLVIVKVKINDKGPYNFILDSGAGLIVITDPTLIDSLAIPNKRIVKLSGLGSGDEYEALIAPHLKMELPGLHSVDVGATIFKKDHFGLSGYAGIPIHGLLGYEFFNKLVVKLNFSDSTLTAYSPKYFRASKRYEKIPITLEGKKPYINTRVTFYDKSERECKLVVDIGAGHALSLEDAEKKQWPTEKVIAANLGMGLTGPINGELGRISSIALGKFSFVNVLSSFPESPAIPLSVPRDGNLGLDILKRFIVIFDYPGGNIYLRSRRDALDEPIEHNMSGLEYFAAGKDLKQVFISRIEPGSPGEEIGLEEDDELVKVNFKPVAQLSLEELDHIFKSKDGRTLVLEVKRKNEKELVVLTLKRRI